jgi:N-formylglutamate deformylase
VPTETFRAAPLYREDCAPDAAGRKRRVATYWQPYHDALHEEVPRLRRQHRNVLLWETHSISSVLPRLFEGKLPDLNIGTLDGRTAAPSVQDAVQRAAAASPFTWIANGRFKGGFITRHCGALQDGAHAVQLEMCQSTDISEDATFDYLPEVAQKVEAAVRGMVKGRLDEVVGLNAGDVRAS